ncbi:hypothetical protein PoB_001589300 [Plakobranchus ocellatus]|uniref:Uncharacterized protein n=1 Tax=Plakobranchus ocellatus TaxID=259542 RepID=A0AAV3Z3R7_9GAST|nr:hypothetical protein PoB_001589300 [Plakobranchus ocellatus]
MDSNGSWMRYGQQWFMDAIWTAIFHGCDMDSNDSWIRYEKAKRFSNHVETFLFDLSPPAMNILCGDRDVSSLMTAYSAGTWSE